MTIKVAAVAEIIHIVFLPAIYQSPQPTLAVVDYRIFI